MHLQFGLNSGVALGVTGLIRGGATILKTLTVYVRGNTWLYTLIVTYHLLNPTHLISLLVKIISDR